MTFHAGFILTIVSFPNSHVLINVVSHRMFHIYFQSSIKEYISDIFNLKFFT